MMRRIREYTSRLDIRIHDAHEQNTGGFADAGIDGVTLLVTDNNDKIASHWVELSNAQLDFLYEWLAAIRLDGAEAKHDAIETTEIIIEDS